MTRFARSLAEDSEWRRWLICGAVVVMAHGGLAAALAQWRDLAESDEAGDAMVIDLAPMPLAVADHAIEELPPGPEQIQAEATPEKPVEQAEEKVEDMVRAVDPDAVLPEPTKPDPPKPAASEPPAAETTAPQLPKLSAKAIPIWKRQVVTLLERHKRYPPDAQAHHEEGIVQLAFSLDRQGHVTASRIIKSSGYETLDNETLALVKRAQPFPPPPAAMPGASINLTVPIRFGNP